MINRVDLAIINNRHPHSLIFTGDNSNAVYVNNAADNFLEEINKNAKREERGSILARYLWSPTAILLSGLSVIGYEYKTLHKLKKYRNEGRILELHSSQKSFKKNLKYTIAGGLLLLGGLEYIFNSQNKKNYENLKKTFDKINTETGAKLSGTFRSNYLGAYCNSPSCSVRVNRNLINDPLSRLSIENLIRHELVHARQFEMIARSKDGIKKINYANIIQVVREAKKNPMVVNEFKQIQKDLQNDKYGKYRNIKLLIQGEEYSFVKYIEAINILLENDKATYNDIPIIIDAEHYNKIIAKKGSLTKDEEQKADEYYKALTNYTPVSAWDAYNPFGSYRNNILEKEAYQANPSLISKLFSK